MEELKTPNIDQPTAVNDLFLFSSPMVEPVCCSPVNIMHPSQFSVLL